MLRTGQSASRGAEKYSYDYDETCSRRAKHDLAYYEIGIQVGQPWNSKIPCRRMFTFLSNSYYPTLVKKQILKTWVHLIPEWVKGRQIKKKRDHHKRCLYLIKICANAEVISGGFWDNGMLVPYHHFTFFPIHSPEKMTHPGRRAAGGPWRAHQRTQVLLGFWGQEIKAWLLSQGT